MLDDLRQYLKLNTLRGYHKSDIIGSGKRHIDPKSGIDYDKLYGSLLSRGLEFEEERRGRGKIPAALVQEIRSLSMPPIPWDVKLADWFDVHVRSIEKHRTFARASRRQSSTPDIPRPGRAYSEEEGKADTFGVVIDTSGSMNASQVGKALGAISSFSIAKNVPFARVVFCDAAAYDAGYLSPDDIAGKVEVKACSGCTVAVSIAKTGRPLYFTNWLTMVSA